MTKQTKLSKLQKEILLKLWTKKEAAKQVGPEGERFCFVRIEEIQGSHFEKSFLLAGNGIAQEKARLCFGTELNGKATQ
jgi:hypothetical protein